MRGFTGIDAPYEPPADAALVIDTSWMSVDSCVHRLMQLLAPLGVAPSTSARAA
jgi:adenylylsulfate kinase